MACVKCNGYWQCSDALDPCDMGFAADVLETETRCFQVYTKDQGDDCRMRIKADGDPPPGEGWSDAGQICLTFDLYSDPETGDCFVRIQPST